MEHIIGLKADSAEARGIPSMRTDHCPPPPPPPLSDLVVAMPSYRHDDDADVLLEEYAHALCDEACAGPPAPARLLLRAADVADTPLALRAHVRERTAEIYDDNLEWLDELGDAFAAFVKGRLCGAGAGADPDAGACDGHVAQVVRLMRDLPVFFHSDPARPVPYDPDPGPGSAEGLLAARFGGRRMAALQGQGCAPTAFARAVAAAVQRHAPERAWLCCADDRGPEGAVWREWGPAAADACAALEARLRGAAAAGLRAERTGGDCEGQSPAPEVDEEEVEARLIEAVDDCVLFVAVPVGSGTGGAAGPGEDGPAEGRAPGVRAACRMARALAAACEGLWTVHVPSVGLYQAFESDGYDSGNAVMFGMLDTLVPGNAD